MLTICRFGTCQRATAIDRCGSAKRKRLRERRVYRCKPLYFYNILDISKLPVFRGVLLTLTVNPQLMH